MKNSKYLVVLCLIAAVLIGSCNGDEEPPTPAPELVLMLPADGQSVDLGAVENISFAWTEVDGAEASRLAVSISSNMGSPQTRTIPENTNPFVLSASDFDAMLANLNIPSEGMETVYWSILPAANATGVTTHAWSLNVTRLPRQTIVLQAPANGVTIDAADFDDAPTFTFTPVEGITAYAIKFALSAADLDVLDKHEIFAVTGSSFSFATSADFDAMLENIGVTFTPEEVFWTVVPVVSNPEVVGQVRSFTGIRKEIIISLVRPVALLEVPYNANTPTNMDVEYALSKRTFDANNNTVIIYNSPIYSFNWIPVSEFEDYSIRFALSEEALSSDFFKIDVPDGATDYRFASLDDLDEMLEGIGMQKGETKTVYWTVVPTERENWYITDALNFIGVRKYAKEPLSLEQVTISGDPTVTTNMAPLFDGRWAQTFLGGEFSNGFAFPWAAECAYGNAGTNAWVVHEDTPENEELRKAPRWLTINAGTSLQLEKYRHYHYWPLRWQTTMSWEIWAYTGLDAPEQNEDWTTDGTWEKIGEGSTATLPTHCAPDQKSRIDVYREGETITFPANVPAAQYYRIRSLENWHRTNIEGCSNEAAVLYTTLPADEQFLPKNNHFANFVLAEIIMWAK